MAKFNFRRFIKVAALITLLLALVEVAVIFVLKQRKDKPVAAHKAKQEQKSKAVDANGSDSRSTTDGNARSEYEQTGQVQYQQKAESNSRFSTTDSSAPKTQGDTTFQRVKRKAKPPVRSLTGGEMTTILNDVNAERKRLNITAKCVQIQKTGNSNVDNAFAVAEFLRRYGYTISGRLTVPETQAGIHFQLEGACIVVLIGRL